LVTQWENLLHLDTIKARSKPLQPPKKPEAAPFFLPTVPTLAGQPAFDTTGAANAGANGDAADHDFEDSDDDGGNAGSRVLRSGKGAASLAAAPSPFVALLRSSAEAADFAGFMAHVRTLSPAALDRELRSMVVLGPVDDPEDAAQQQEVADVGLLLEALLGELDACRNFEMVQALTARVLTVSVSLVLLCRALGSADSFSKLGVGLIVSRLVQHDGYENN
jgi:U3 small nucleolar RNA-associated protein 21